MLLRNFYLAHLLLLVNLLLQDNPSLVIYVQIRLFASLYLHHIVLTHATPLFIRCSIIALYLFMHCTHSCTLFIYALHSFIHHIHSYIAFFKCCNYSCIALTHATLLFMHYTHLCVPLINVLYSLICYHCLCVAFIYLSHLFILCTYFIHHTHSTIHLFIRCIHLRITPYMRYVAFLLLCISHVACNLLNLFFSLTYIRSQTFWQQWSATIKINT